jgi:4-diphosphocytidyl-2C-methyl-D-erythritol kinase
LAGADHAIVSGSGPTVVGILWGNDATQRAQKAVFELSPRFPGATVAEPVTASIALPDLVI